MTYSQLPLFIKREDAAEYLRISISTLQRWLKSGKLKSIKLPDGHVRIYKRSLKAFLN